MTCYITGNNIQNPTTFHHLHNFCPCPSHHHPSAHLLQQPPNHFLHFHLFLLSSGSLNDLFKPGIVTHDYSIHLHGFSSQSSFKSSSSYTVFPTTHPITCLHFLSLSPHSTPITLTAAPPPRWSLNTWQRCSSLRVSHLVGIPSTGSTPPSHLFIPIWLAPSLPLGQSLPVLLKIAVPLPSQHSLFRSLLVLHVIYHHHYIFYL